MKRHPVKLVLRFSCLSSVGILAGCKKVQPAHTKLALMSFLTLRYFICIGIYILNVHSCTIM